jgi:hypothetical protein
MTKALDFDKERIDIAIGGAVKRWALLKREARRGKAPDKQTREDIADLLSQALALLKK